AYVRQLDHLGDVAARDPLGDDDDQLDPVLDRLQHRVLGEGGGDGDDGAVDRGAVVRDRLGDGVEDRHAVDLAALAAGGDAADDLGAVVEALLGQVDRLAAGDPLADEGEVFAPQDAHAEIRSTAGPAASHIETVRSLNSIPYLPRIFAPSSSQAPGILNTAIVSAGSLPTSRQAPLT